MKILIFISLFITSPFAMAGNTSEQPKIENIVSAISLDMDSDNLLDLAYLANSENPSQENLTLWVKLSTQDTYYKVENLANDMNGGMFGMGTILKVNDLDSIQVNSMNDSVGRGRWDETITFAYRNDRFVFAGYTYFQRDTLDLSFSTCDVNVLSKKGIYESSVYQENNQEKAKIVKFDVLTKDVLSLERLSAESLSDTYLMKYCYSFDVHEQE